MTLAFRLGAFFLTALALLLGGFSTALYLLARTHLQRDLDERLSISLDALAAAAEIEPDGIEWRPGLHRPPEVTHLDDAPVSWAAFDAQGDLLNRCGDGDFTGALRMGPEVGHVHITFVDLDARRWRVVVRRLVPARPPAERKDPGEQRNGKGHSIHSSLTLVAGTPLAPMEASLRNAALTMAGLSTGLWLLAGAAGRLLTQRALLPVTRMAQTAREMTAEHKEQRLPSPGTGDELEDLARSFNGLLGRLHEALERQRRFTGDASHQLRTPLTALISEVELARRRERSPEDYRRVLDRVHGDAVRLRQIVESLLFLARADAEAERPALETVDLVAWLSDHLRHWSHHERACDLRLETASHSPAWARVHASLLSQLLDNLVDNACKYSAPGSPVMIRVERAGGNVSLVVEDRGQGIDPADLPHIFEPFFRSTRGYPRGTPGFGLGLAVVQRIADALGGKVAVESISGRGCRFTVRFPEASAPAGREGNGTGVGEERVSVAER
ncbi:MAG: ATP-binding protein [Isosphaeraceae bacterium]|nr:ATP-binding protein [Isosphaeraceae bacterium]